MSDRLSENELFELVGGWCHGALDDAQFARLQAELVASPQARELFVNYMDLHSEMLWSQQASPSAVAPDEPVAARGSVVTFLQSCLDYRHHTLRFTLLIGLLTCWFWVWMAAVLDWGDRTPLIIARPDASVSRPSVVARLTHAQDERWRDSTNAPAAGGFLVAGRKLELAAGWVELTFQSGAKLRLQGPAELRVDDRAACTLLRGQLVASVQPAAAGFVVETPQVRLVDLGTEFGVSVQAADGQIVTEAIVYTGMIEAIPLGIERAGSKRLRAGESLAVSAASPDWPAASEQTQRQLVQLHQDAARVPVVPVVRKLFVRNANFEDLTTPPLIGEGTNNGIRIGAVPGWRLERGDGVGGVYNPDQTYYLAANDAASPYFGSLPNMRGPTAAFLFNGRLPSHLTQTLTGDDGEPGTADDPRLEAGHEYRLSVAIGVRSDEKSFAAYRVELLAGEEVLASTSGTNPPGPAGGFYDVVASALPVAADHPALGEPLSIRLTKLPGGRYFDFDHVRVTQSPRDFKALSTNSSLD